MTCPLAEFLTQSDDFYRQCSSFYEPLDPDRHTIRLMQILPGPFEQESIDVTLITVRLEDKPVYEALSYTWESLTPTSQITIHDIPYNVTQNQYLALRRLRLVDQIRTMWMDVVCINQADLVERSQQVSIMNEIYTNSVQTQVWIGEPDTTWSEITDHDWEAHTKAIDADVETTSYMQHCALARPKEILPHFLDIVMEHPDGVLKGAIHVLELMASGVSLRDMPFSYYDDAGVFVHCRPFYHVWEMLQSLFKRPWWNRVWVLQEACLSKITPLLYIGSQQTSIRTFTDARSWLTDGWKSWQPEDSLLAAVYDFSTLLENLGSLNNYAVALDISSQKFGRMRSSMAMGLVGGRNVTDRRDFVYGIQGLIQKQDRILIDYQLNVGEVFALASWEAYNDYPSAWNLLKHASGIAATGIPSWTIDWATFNEAYFVNSDIFEDAEPVDQDLVEFYPDEGILKLAANQIDKIATVLEMTYDPEMNPGTQALGIIDSWVQKLSTIGILPDSRLNADSDSTLTFLSTVFRESKTNETGKSVRCTTMEDFEEMLRWIEDLRLTAKDGTEPLMPYDTIRRVRSDFMLSVNDSRLCVTDKGFLCIATDSIQRGDYLLHIRGCCVPLALRVTDPVRLFVYESEEPDITPFKVVGPCYIKGAMGSDGAGFAKEQTIYLV